LSVNDLLACLLDCEALAVITTIRPRLAVFAVYTVLCGYVHDTALQM